MKNCNTKCKIIVASCILLAGLGLLAWVVLRGAGTAGDSSLVSFAQCLAGKGATMYGAEWCPHCQNEKRAFGEAFKYVSYVECPKEPARCLAAGITGYPTWIFPASPAGEADGKRLEGERGLEKLAAESGCEL